MRSACGPTAWRLLPHGPLDLGEAVRVEAIEELVVCLDAAGLELCDQPAVDPRQEPDRVPLDSRRPAAFEEAAARALRPADRLVRLLLAQPEAEDLAEDLERLRAAVVGDVDDRADPVVDLERDRRLAEHLLVEPAVGLELQLDLGVGAVADSPRELRVADRVAAAGREHEVRDADDLDVVAVELGLGAEDALVDDSLALGDRLEGALRSLLQRAVAQVDRIREPRQVALLVLAAEPHQHLAVGARRRLLDSLLPKPDAKAALGGAVVAVEVGRDQAEGRPHDHSLTHSQRLITAAFRIEAPGMHPRSRRTSPRR